MGRSNPAPSRTATPQQLAQHARRLAEAADREASRLARAAPSDMPHAQTFFRSQSLSPGDGSDYLSPPSSLPTVAPVAANAAQDVVPETQALTGGNAAAALIAAVAPGATGGTASHRSRQSPASKKVSSIVHGGRQDHRRTPSRVHECVQLKRVGYQRRFSQHAGVRAERLDGPDVGKPKPNQAGPEGQARPNAPSNGVSPKAG